MLGGAFFALGMGYTLLKNEHVRVDIFYNKFSKRTQATVDVVLTLCLFLPCFGLLLYHLVPYVYDSWATSEKSLESFWRPPIYPFKTVLLISIILLLLQGLATLARAAQILFPKESE
jgi:TRAP-type mannitol/chloroaromatic compound transport system permease small subunit